MSIVKVFSGAIKDTFVNQWREIITSGQFDEFTVVTPGILKQNINRKSASAIETNGVITNGSRIYIPENTAAFIFSQSGIEEIITEAGGYEYNKGEKSLLNGDSMRSSIFKPVMERVKFGGNYPEEKRIAFVNLREVRNIKFGTRGPLVYNDLFYGTDLEVQSFGTFSIRISDPETFIKNFVPANVSFYTFEDKKVRMQIISEFLHSFTIVLNSLSKVYRISELPSRSNEISEKITGDTSGVGSWRKRFGFEIIHVGIHNIKFSQESRELVKQFSSNKMNLKSFEDISQKSSNIAAQQKIAQGIENHGLGDGGLLFGMNIAQSLGSQGETKNTMTLDEQIELLKKLKELLDAGILSQNEFDDKKKDILGL